VRLERGGRRIGLGAVLRNDGRILTALSAIGHGNYIQARFSDGSLSSVRVVASDRPWDLALLTPEGLHWSAGLRPSGVAAAAADGVQLRRFRGQRLEESRLTVSGRRSLLGRDGVVLQDALVLGGALAEEERGSPLFDDAGEVVGVVVTACSPASARDCQLAPYAAPVSAIKSFLRKAPARDPLPSAWLGLRGVAGHEGSVAGVRVISVEPGSPAALAGLRAEGDERRPVRDGARAGAATGDLVVAVEDVPVTTPEELRDAINRVALAGAASNAGAAQPPARPQRDGAPAAVVGAPAAGDGAAEHPVRVLLYGSGKFREAVIPLRAPRKIPQAGPTAPRPNSGARMQPRSPDSDRS
jgi:S1-C subfamily serine protease